MGFSLEGYFIGFESRTFKNDDGSVDVKYSVNVATGNLAYRVYIKDGFDINAFSDLKPGDLIALSVRCYVGKNGKLSLVDGELI